MKRRNGKRLFLNQRSCLFITLLPDLIFLFDLFSQFFFPIIAHLFDDLMTDPVSRVPVFQIGLIDPVRDSVLIAIIAQFFFGEAEQRTKDLGAVEDVFFLQAVKRDAELVLLLHQVSLDQIVHLMCDQDQIEISFLTDLPEEPVTVFSGSGLKIARMVLRIEIMKMEKDPVFCAIIPDDPFVPISRFPFVVVDMSGFDICTGLTGHIEKGHRIRPS